MTDLDPGFTRAIEAYKREARAETIARARVISLRPDMTAPQRGQLAITALQSAMDQLEMLADHLPADAADDLDEIECRLALLRPRLRMKRSIVHLTDVFGRAP